MFLLPALPATLSLLPISFASPQPQATACSSAATCQDDCYSALYASASRSYLCNVWEARYPPAIYTSTRLYVYTPTIVYHSYGPTRAETRYALSASPSTTLSPTALPKKRTQASAGATHPLTSQVNLEARQDPTTTTTTTITSVPGLPLPDPTLASACSDSPAAFWSACKCIGKSSYTIYTDAYATASDTVTSTATGYTCTTTTTLEPACAASTGFGLRPTSLRWGDSGYEGFVEPAVVKQGNGTTAEGCCRACFESEGNCRFFTYGAPGGVGLGDGGVCELDLEGDTCPVHVFPNTGSSNKYNYITEGMYSDPGVDTNGTYYGFGPCGVEVPMFYGYQNGRGGNPETCVAGGVAPVTTYAH